MRIQRAVTRLPAAATAVSQPVSPYGLRWRRLQAGITQADLAKRLGVSKSYISNVELGLTVCSARAKEAYEALKV